MGHRGVAARQVCRTSLAKLSYIGERPHGCDDATSIIRQIDILLGAKKQAVRDHSNCII